MSRLALGACISAIIGLGILSELAEAADSPYKLHPMTRDNGNLMYVWIDPQTGCHYLINSKGGIVPRIAADGRSHAGCKGVKP